MSKRRRLHELVTSRRGVVGPGAYDCVSAKLVERAGSTHLRRPTMLREVSRSARLGPVSSIPARS